MRAVSGFSNISPTYSQNSFSPSPVKNSNTVIADSLQFGIRPKTPPTPKAFTQEEAKAEWAKFKTGQQTKTTPSTSSKKTADGDKTPTQTTFTAQPK